MLKKDKKMRINLKNKWLKVRWLKVRWMKMQWLKVQEGYSKNISEFKAFEEIICQSQGSDLKVVESEEGKSKIHLPNYISRCSVTSENWLDLMFSYKWKLTTFD